MTKLLRYFLLFLSICSLAAFTGCKKKVLPVTVQVPDSIRHYYPLVSGDELELSYVIRNMGESPLVIDDVQPSCGCISHKLNAKIIPPHDTLQLNFTFNSHKNVGYVRHAIRIFGNILPKGFATLVFDVNVVPPSDHDYDYEEYYRKIRPAETGVEELVDGTNANKPYFVDKNERKLKDDGHEHPWNKDE